MCGSIHTKAILWKSVNVPKRVTAKIPVLSLAFAGCRAILSRLTAPYCPLPVDWASLSGQHGHSRAICTVVITERGRRGNRGGDRERVGREGHTVGRTSSVWCSFKSTARLFVVLHVFYDTLLGCITENSWPLWWFEHFDRIGYLRKIWYF